MRLFLVLAFVGCVDHGSSQFEPPVDNVEPSIIEEEEPPWDLPTDAYERWMRCMTFEDFQASQMGVAWNYVAAVGSQKCASCHENGSDGFLLSADETKFFNVISKQKYFAQKFMAPTSNPTSPYVVVEVNRKNFEAVASGAVPHAEHPRFDPRSAYDETGDFIDRTTARYYASPGCGQ